MRTVVDAVAGDMKIIPVCLSFQLYQIKARPVFQIFSSVPGDFRDVLSNPSTVTEVLGE